MFLFQEFRNLFHPKQSFQKFVSTTQKSKKSGGCKNLQIHSIQNTAVSISCFPLQLGHFMMYLWCIGIHHSRKTRID